MVPARAPMVGRRRLRDGGGRRARRNPSSCLRFKGRALDATGVLEVGFDEVFPEVTFIMVLPDVKFCKVEHLR